MLTTKKCIAMILVACFASQVNAADLLEVYNQAQQSDPIFQQAIATRLRTKTGLPISVATILPSLVFQATPSITRTGVSGTNLATFAGLSISPRNTTTRAYSMTLTATQTIFDFSKFSAVRGAYALAKGADASLNAAIQDLMVRVAKAYFAVLKDEDNLRFVQASKVAYEQQLDQVKEQYNVGLKTVTDLDIAQASYDSAVANVIAAQSRLNNDRENLRSLTGRFYPNLAKLRDDFPLVSPQPADIDAWVDTAQKQNWSIREKQYLVDSKLQYIRQQYAGHMPTVNAQLSWDRLYTRNISGYNSLTDRQGPGTTTDRTAAININFPIFSGGGVVASTNQATYDYQYTQQVLEQTIRDTLNATRRSYLNIMTGISQIKADRQAVKSSFSSLRSIRASFKVGTETLVDVLTQQQKVLEKQYQYANDRYDFVNNLLLLKQAAGTLNFDDLHSVNSWLSEETKPIIKKKKAKKLKLENYIK